MTFHIDQSQFFLDQFRMLPAEIVPRVQKGIAALQQDPRPFGKNRTALRGLKDPKQYRLRIAKYRLIYSFDSDTVCLRNVDKRAEAYVRNTGKGYVSVPDDEVADDDDAIEVEDAESAVHQSWTLYRQQLAAWVDARNESALATVRETATPAGKAKVPDRPATQPVPTPLPQAVTHAMLRLIGIPRRYHKLLAACRTDVDLVAATIEHGVPAEVVDRVFNVVAEPAHEPVTQQPVKRLREIDDLRRFHEGDLLDFQVSMDPAQRQVARSLFGSSGSWLISGAAGTGKSTVLLEVAIETHRRARERGASSRILFTTYTNALVKSTEDVLDRIYPGPRPGFDVCTTDSLVLDIVGREGFVRKAKESDSLQGILRPIVQDVLRPDNAQLGLFAQHEGFDRLPGTTITLEPLMGMTWNYLLEEIEQVIVGRNMVDREDYLTAPRTGRGVGLGDVQRNRIWDISTAFTRELDRRQWTTYPRLRQRAAGLLESGQATDRYDAVFIDEAQDLQPNAIRILVEMSRAADGAVGQLYFSADGNQTIYGSSYSWVSVHPDLRLQGRSRRLEMNHRSTRQIIEAARAYLGGAELESDRTDLKHRNAGPPPTAIWGVPVDSEFDHILRFFATSCGEIGRDAELCAVLVSSEGRGKRIEAGLREAGVPARFMARKDLDLSFEGVKVVTRHTAKGLEFPIVALSLVGLREQVHGEMDESLEAALKERRLNHMAMTRAMRSLLVTLPDAPGDNTYSGISEPLWKVERASGPV